MSSFARDWLDRAIRGIGERLAPSRVRIEGGTIVSRRPNGRTETIALRDIRTICLRLRYLGAVETEQYAWWQLVDDKERACVFRDTARGIVDVMTALSGSPGFDCRSAYRLMRTQGDGTFVCWRHPDVESGAAWHDERTSTLDTAGVTGPASHEQPPIRSRAAVAPFDHFLDRTCQRSLLFRFLSGWLIMPEAGPAHGPSCSRQWHGCSGWDCR
jgi:hypothetical protein